MEKFLITANSDTLLNLRNIISITIPSCRNELHGYTAVQSQRLLHGIYAEQCAGNPTRLLDVIDIDAALRQIENLEMQEILKRSLAMTGRLEILLNLIMTNVKKQLLEDIPFIDMSKILADTLLTFCAFSDLMEVARVERESHEE